MLGCLWDRRAQAFGAPSETTFQRVLARRDPAGLKRGMQRWTRGGDLRGVTLDAGHVSRETLPALHGAANWLPLLGGR